jgi:predicted glycoside hydrolase/deacetylase ChbG (UPF0249 family)
MKIVVNADDYGASSEVNGAILESFDRGWISSTTIMANMPAFEEACTLARDKGIADRIGLHFNLATGMPLTEGIRRSPTFCNSDQRFHLAVKDGMILSAGDRELLKAELAAQWNALVEHGLDPVHIDSHHHRHYSWSVIGVVVQMSRSLGIRAVRPARWSATKGRSFARGLYSKLINVRLHRAGLLATRFMVGGPKRMVGDPKDMFPADGSPDPFEIMVHPTRGRDGEVRNYNGGDLLHDIVGSLPYSNSFYSYGELLKRSG